MPQEPVSESVSQEPVSQESVSQESVSQEPVLESLMPPTEHVNEVTLVGRLAAPIEERELPSGDVVATFRLVVERGGTRRPGSRSPRVDTLDCSIWTATTRRQAAGWRSGDVLCVQGALRRRFWRNGAAAVSRSEVEVLRVRRVRKAG